ncbi:hypothetical protein EON64_21350, partial [archaeon]
MPEAFDKVRALGVTASHPRELLALGMARRPGDLEGFLPIADLVLRPYTTLKGLQHLSVGELRAQGLDEFESLRTRICTAF